MTGQHSVKVPVPIAIIIPFAPWNPTGHSEADNWPAKTIVNGAPLPGTDALTVEPVGTGVGVGDGEALEDPFEELEEVVGPVTVGAASVATVVPAPGSTMFAQTPPDEVETPFA